MGTNGYIVVVFEGKYYRIFNHYDSYPSLLGEMVVRVLKTVRLESTIECVGIILEAMKVALSEYYGPICGKYGEGPGRYSAEPVTMNIETVTNERMEWNYFICLDSDKMGFFVRGHGDFNCRGHGDFTWPLADIPDDWMDVFENPDYPDTDLELPSIAVSSPKRSPPAARSHSLQGRHLSYPCRLRQRNEFVKFANLPVGKTIPTPSNVYFAQWPPRACGAPGKAFRLTQSLRLPRAPSRLTMCSTRLMPLFLGLLKY